MRVHSRNTAFVCTLVSIFFLASCSQKNVKKLPPVDATDVSFFSAPAAKEPDPKIDAGILATQAKTEPIRFSTLGIGAIVTKRQMPASLLVDLVRQTSIACKTPVAAGALDRLAATYSKATALSYATSTVRNPSRYTLTVIPNLVRATDKAGGQQLFPFCDTPVGYQLLKVSPDWLVFKTPCLATDAACQLLSTKIEGSLVIK